MVQPAKEVASKHSHRSEYRLDRALAEHQLRPAMILNYPLLKALMKQKQSE
jgi:hypothetical protein